jgi:hypothetical protein
VAKKRPRNRNTPEKVELHPTLPGRARNGKLMKGHPGMAMSSYEGVSPSDYLPSDIYPNRDRKGRLMSGHPGLPGAGRPVAPRKLMEDITRILHEPAEMSELEDMFARLQVPVGMQATIMVAEDRQEVFARALVYLALRGDPTVRDAIMSRLAPVPRPVEISGPEGGPVRTLAMQLTATTTLSPEEAKAAYLAALSPERAP